MLNTKRLNHNGKCAVSALIAAAAISVVASHSFAANKTWDAGGGANTDINTAANWDLDTLPVSGTDALTSITGGSSINMNVDFKFLTALINRGVAFTIGGPGALQIMSVNSATTQNLTVSSGIGGNLLISAPLQVDTTNTTNKLLSIRNNAAAGKIFTISGNISRTSNSTADAGLRFDGLVGSVTRIEGTISNVATIQQSFSTAWAGDFILAGNKSNASTAVGIVPNTTGTAPAATARLFLGETPADTQTWGNLTLANTGKIVIGGNITAGAFSVGTNATAANSKVVGNSATNSTLSLTNGTISGNVTFGGSGTNENNMNLVKAGTGTLTISGGTHTYAGTTTINGGTLTVASGVSLATSGIIVNSSTVLNENAALTGVPITLNSSGSFAGEGSTTGSLTFGNGTSSFTFDPTTGGAFTTGSVTFNAGSTVIISPSGAVSIGTPYTVMTNTSGFGGSVPANFVSGSRGSLSLAGGGSNPDLVLTPTAAASLTWKGNVSGSTTLWDTVGVQNWSSGSPDRFYSADSVTFDDSASTYTVAPQGASVAPQDMTFNNSSNDYTFTGGTINVAGNLTKNGSRDVTISSAISGPGALDVNSGTLTLSNSATSGFAGAITLDGGKLAVSSMNQVGGLTTTRAIQFNGGELEWNYTATSAQTSDSVPLQFNSGTSTITLLGTFPEPVSALNGLTFYPTLRFGAVMSGSGNLVKNGTGILSIGRNSGGNLGNGGFSGNIIVNGGILDIRNPDSMGDTTGTTTINNACIDIFPFGQSFDVAFNAESITMSGNSYIRVKNENTTLGFNHSLTGTLTVANNAVIGIGSPRQATASTSIANTLTSVSSSVTKLTISGNVSTGTNSIINLGTMDPTKVTSVLQNTVPQAVELAGNISGGGSISTQGAAASTYTLSGANTYSGTTSVNGGVLSVSGSINPTIANTASIASGATLDVSGAGVVNFAAVTNNGTFSTANGGTVAGITGTGTTNVTGGTLSSSAAIRQNTLNISGGSAASISAIGLASGVSVVSNLSIDASSKLEIHDNDLVIDYGSNPSQYVNLVSKVLSGLTLLGGTGTNGITSVEVDAQTVPGTVLAVVDDGDPNISGGITAISGFSVPNPATSVLVKFTWFGDANLDGIVDGSDYALTDTGFTSGGSLGGWVFGDYDYNSFVDGSDYALQDTGFISQSGSLPEPTAIGLFAIGALGVLRRRRA